MNYHQYYPTDVLNGPGIRAVLFVSGCAHACPGCYNESTWSPKSGHNFDSAIEDRIIADLKDTRINRRGLTLSGGDPLYPTNIRPIRHLVNRVRAECPDKDIWMWTGYTMEDLKKHKDRNITDNDRYHLAMSVDTLVDGKFVQDLYDPNLRFRGSSNQLIIDIKSL